MYGPGGPSVAALVGLILLAIYIKQLKTKSTGKCMSMSPPMCVHIVMCRNRESSVVKD